MASKGTTKEGLPIRDKVQGRRDLEKTMREENHEGFSVGSENRPSSPDGWGSAR